jgi:hypothetical protein
VNFLLPVLNVVAQSQSSQNERDHRRSQSKLTAEGRTIIGKTTYCVDPSCKGWLVDSFLGKKYWIQCLDKKHSVDKNQVENRKAGSFGGETSEPADKTDGRHNPPIALGELYHEYSGHKE